MAETNKPPGGTDPSDADADAWLEEAEAEAAAAEAAADAAKARARAARLRREARAARLRREALGVPEPTDDYSDDEYYDGDYDEDYDEDHGEDYGEDYEEDYEELLTEQTGWRRRMPMIAAVIAIILIVCFAGASVFMVFQHRDNTAHHQREAAFVEGAKHAVLNMISLNYNKAKEDVQRVIDSSTGQFKDDFQRNANDFIAVVTQSKTITEGTVNAAAIESMDEDSAVVLVAATSQVTNSPAGKDQPPKVWRLKVTVAEVGGQYKMSKVEYVA
jgi:Mce-associated membrane protein